MSKTRLGIAGVGNLGSRHAALAAQLPQIELTGLFDPDGERAATVAAQVGAPVLASFDELLASVDAVLLATPTSTHAELAMQALERGVHVFVEKPLAASMEQGREMIAAADKSGCVLQVGHVERFNPAVMELVGLLKAPRFIEVHRLGPLAPQVRDVGVVLDLMIHDLDLLLWLIEGPVASVEAVGVSVLTPREDIANARIRFASGCIANVTASRITTDPQRKIRFFQDDAYLSLDYAKRRLDVYRKDGAGAGMAAIRHDVHDLDLHNALQMEIADFAVCVQQGHAPRVSGRDGLAALELATHITDLIAQGQS